MLDQPVFRYGLKWRIHVDILLLLSTHAHVFEVQLLHKKINHSSEHSKVVLKFFQMLTSTNTDSQVKRSLPKKQLLMRVTSLHEIRFQFYCAKTESAEI